MADGLVVTAGARYYVAPGPIADDVTAFEGLSWTEIAGVEDLGELGDTSEDLTITLAAERRVRHIKGPVDGGVVELICARMPEDEGQVEMRSAANLPGEEATRNFKVTLLDGTEYYFGGNVLDGRTAIGTADNIIRTTFRIAVNSDLIEVIE